MGDVIGFVEIASAIIAAMGLAMGLEWLTLNGLLRLMPSRRQPGADTERVIGGDAAGRAEISSK